MCVPCTCGVRGHLSGVESHLPLRDASQASGLGGKYLYLLSEF